MTYDDIIGRQRWFAGWPVTCGPLEISATRKIIWCTAFAQCQMTSCLWLSPRISQWRFLKKASNGLETVEFLPAHGLSVAMWRCGNFWHCGFQAPHEVSAISWLHVPRRSDSTMGLKELSIKYIQIPSSLSQVFFILSDQWFHRFFVFSFFTLEECSWEAEQQTLKVRET